MASAERVALYTSLNQKQITKLMQPFSLGHLLSYKGILAGTVNTYYRIISSTGTYYLKVDETADLKRLKREIKVFELLKKTAPQLSFKIPLPLKNNQGKFFISLGKKFVLFFKEVEGRSILPTKLTKKHLVQMADSLAQIHLATLNTPLPSHRFCLREMSRVFTQIKNKLLSKHPAIHDFVLQKMTELKKSEPSQIPQALIHADLFSENVLFMDDHLNGIVDFEAAGRGPCLFDVCVGLHALCVKGKKLDVEKMKLFLKAYQNTRPLSADEKKYFSYYMQQTAMRFLLTRLRDFELKDGPVKAKPFKDYREYVKRFEEIEILFRNGLPHFV